MNGSFGVFVLVLSWRFLGDLGVRLESHAENAKIAKILIKNLGALGGVRRSYAKASRRER
jgi:hypothetical protein